VSLIVKTVLFRPKIIAIKGFYMLSVAIVLQFVLAVFMTIAVMLQKSSSMGLGAYSGSNESLFGAKGPAGFLTKATFAIGFLFIANTIFLSYSYNSQRNKSVVDSLHTNIPASNTTTSNAPVAPVVPAAPVVPSK
jgi:preprotein translocase subunit SecG